MSVIKLGTAVILSQDTAVSEAAACIADCSSFGRMLPVAVSSREHFYLTCRDLEYELGPYIRFAVLMDTQTDVPGMVDAMKATARMRYRLEADNIGVFWFEPFFEEQLGIPREIWRQKGTPEFMEFIRSCGGQLRRDRTMREIEAFLKACDIDEEQRPSDRNLI